MQLVNAGKYVSKLAYAVAVATGSRKYYIQESEDDGSFLPFFITQMIATVYSLYWEFNWDWGLFYRKLPGHKLLRDKMVF